MSYSDYIKRRMGNISENPIQKIVEFYIREGLAEKIYEENKDKHPWQMWQEMQEQFKDD